MCGEAAVEGAPPRQQQHAVEQREHRSARLVDRAHHLQRQQPTVMLYGRPSDGRVMHVLTVARPEYEAVGRVSLCSDSMTVMAVKESSPLAAEPYPLANTGAHERS